MQVHYDGKQRKLTPLEAEIGIQDWNAPVVQAYLQRKKKRFQEIAAQMQKGNQPEAETYQQFAKEIDFYIQEAEHDDGTERKM